MAFPWAWEPPSRHRAGPLQASSQFPPRAGRLIRLQMRELIYYGLWQYIYII